MDGGVLFLGPALAFCNSSECDSAGSLSRPAERISYVHVRLLLVWISPTRLYFSYMCEIILSDLNRANSTVVTSNVLR